jgi:hypothetical protein
VGGIGAVVRDVYCVLVTATYDWKVLSLLDSKAAEVLAMRAENICLS